MFELKTIENNDLDLASVDARSFYFELHETKDSQNFTQFMTKVKRDFEEGYDWILLNSSSLNPRLNQKVGRPSSEYLLSIECAKNVALMSRTERGKKYRKYLITIESEVKRLPSQHKRVLEQKVEIMEKFISGQTTLEIPNVENVVELKRRVEFLQGKTTYTEEMERLLKEVDYLQASTLNKDAQTYAELMIIENNEKRGWENLYVECKAKNEDLERVVSSFQKQEVFRDDLVATYRKDYRRMKDIYLHFREEFRREIIKRIKLKRKYDHLEEHDTLTTAYASNLEAKIRVLQRDLREAKKKPTRRKKRK